MDNPHGHPCPSISYLIYSILHVYSHGEIGLFQLLITVRCVITQLLFNADKLVVLGHTVGTTHRTRLNLTRVGCYGNIGNCSILGFTRTMGSNGGVTMAMSHLDSIQCSR